jgi:hypothetical protein
VVNGKAENPACDARGGSAWCGEYGSGGLVGAWHGGLGLAGVAGRGGCGVRGEI